MQIFNKVFNLGDLIYWKLNRFWFTSFQLIELSLKGIKFGNCVNFYGKATFKRASSANIRFGDNCNFRSSATSNLIGINRPCIITALSKKANLIIGNNCGFSGTVIGCFKEIIIGNNVKCGANTLITDSDWHLEDSRSSKPLPIIINDNVWLGVNVTVLKGVTIGQNSIIGAGSIVTKNIPANVVAAGNPCRVIKAIN